MTVWFAIPSALPYREALDCFRKWGERGYATAAFRDTQAKRLPLDLCVHGSYPGYARAVNMLAAAVLRLDPECRWIVTAGDDVFPDPDHSPEQIAAECEEHFGGTLGVMQPTGDVYMVDVQGRGAAERCAISPWMGREWCERAYEGKGPLWPAFVHEGVDNDLHYVATKLGLLWHRPDLSHYHAWARRLGKPVPEHQSNKAAANRAGNRMFEERKAAGFPGSGLLGIGGQA